MSDTTKKEAIFEHFRERQVKRRAEILVERQAETEEAILGTVVETSMAVDDGIVFLKSDGEREDAA